MHQRRFYFCLSAVAGLSNWILMHTEINLFTAFFL